MCIDYYNKLMLYSESTPAHLTAKIKFNSLIGYESWKDLKVAWSFC